MRSKKEELSNMVVFIEIVKWLYSNDGVFNSGKEWKAELIEFLARLLKVV
jgi:hypothetical protein